MEAVSFTTAGRAGAALPPAALLLITGSHTMRSRPWPGVQKVDHVTSIILLGEAESQCPRILMTFTTPGMYVLRPSSLLTSVTQSWS